MAEHVLPAVWMRGGTSKGLFLEAAALPGDAAERHALLARALGSPDPYGQQIDGVGGGTSSTSKVVVLSPQAPEACDVHYWFGHVDRAQGLIDESGNCGNLTAAVGVYAVTAGWVRPQPGWVPVTVWQANLGRVIRVDVPCDRQGVRTRGDFRIAGVPEPGAEVPVTFFEPGGQPGSGVLPSGRPVDRLDAGDGTTVAASLVDAGNPTVFVDAQALGLSADEQSDAAISAAQAERLEALRCRAAVAMGLEASVRDAHERRPATPKIAWVAPAAGYTDSTGEPVAAEDCDLRARILSMGRLHHAYTGTGAVATAVAAALPGTRVAEVCGGPRSECRIGHRSGVMTARAELERSGEGWRALHAGYSRTARQLMSGQVHLP